MPLRIQLKEFMEEQGKINKDTVTKFKAMDKILENIDGKVTEVGSSNLQVLNMMKMLETQVAQLAGHLSSNEGKLPGNLNVRRRLRQFKLARERRPKNLNMQREQGSLSQELKWRPSSRRRCLPPMPEMVTEEPEFELDDIDTKILPLRPRYRKGKHEDEQFNKFVDMVRRLSINMPLLDALQVPTYSRYFKDIMGNKREIPPSTVKLTEECSAAIANEAPEKKRDPGCPTIPCSIGSLMIERALCDLGASVSVMPKNVFEKLCLPEPEPTAMCLGLADISVRYPLGIRP